MNHNGTIYPITNDYIFGTVLRRNPDLSRELLELILGVRIREIRQVSLQVTEKQSVSSHGVRFDVVMDDDGCTHYIVEMQLYKSANLRKRSRFYHAVSDVNSLMAGMDYTSLPKSYVIFICLSMPDDMDNRLPIYTFENLCREDPSIRLDDAAYKVFVNASCIAETSPSIRSLFTYLTRREVSDVFTERMDHAVLEANEDPEVKLLAMTLEERVMEARLDAQLEWREKGLQEGRQEGRQEGIADGILATRRQVVLSGTSAGLPDQTIAELLGITEEEVTVIRKGLL